MPQANTVLQTAMTSVFDALDHILSDEFMLYIKTRKYHWNVEGPQFRELHKLFEDLEVAGNAAEPGPTLP